VAEAWLREHPHRSLNGALRELVWKHPFLALQQRP
jgi:hypothetical protein